MSTPDTSALPASLRHALSAVARKRLTVQLTAGVAWLVIVIVLLLVAQTALDRAMDFSRAVRAVLLAADALVLGVVVVRGLYRPWRRRWHASEAAFAMQRHWPELGSQVISAVQLAPSADRPGLGSPLLVQALVQQAADTVATLPVGRIVRARPAVNRSLLALALAGAVVGYAVLHWPLASVLLRRVVLSGIPLPTSTIVVAETRDLRQATGTSVTLAALAEGVVPSQGRLELALAGGEHRTLLVTTAVDRPGRFAYTLENVQQSFTYRFQLGDGHGAEFKVTVFPAPLLERASFIQEFPAYTGRPPLTQPAGALTFFPGSKVRVIARSSQPLRRMELRFAGDEAAAAIALTTDAADPRGAKGEFVVPVSGLTGLSLPLTSAEGIAAADTTVYPVRLETDRPPTVKIEAPLALADTLVPTASLAVRARVADDFAVARVELVRETGGVQKRRRLDVAADGTVAYVFSPAEEQPALAVGTQFNWWIEVTDNNNATGPGVGSSEHRQLGVVSFEQKQQEMLQRLEETSRRVEDVARRQGEIRDSLGEALRKLTPTPSP